MILYLCDIHLFVPLPLSFTLLPLSISPPSLQFFPARVLRDCLAVVPVFCYSFVTSISSAAEANVSLCDLPMGLVPLSPRFSSDSILSLLLSTHTKKMEWKGRLASKLINDNLITFHPTWNSQTMNFAPMCQPKIELYRKILKRS